MLTVAACTYPHMHCAILKRAAHLQSMIPKTHCASLQHRSPWAMAKFVEVVLVVGRRVLDSSCMLDYELLNQQMRTYMYIPER